MTPPARRRTPLIATLAALTLLAAVAGWWWTQRDLDQATAERECRAAIEREAARRAGLLGDTAVTNTITGVQVADTRQTGDGWTVNADVTYTITGTQTGTTRHTAAYTCEATRYGGRVNTAVRNRP